MMNGYFITGTDTEIGKTYVLSQLFAWLNNARHGGSVAYLSSPRRRGSIHHTSTVPDQRMDPRLRGDDIVIHTTTSCEAASGLLKTHYLALKPVASGFEDLIAIQSLQPDVQEPICGWSYAEPIAPHFAAARQGQQLSAQAIADWCLKRAGQQRVLIEGAGGLLMPLNDTESWVDVIQQLKIPVILVVGLRLGCMNHALLTDQVMQAEGLVVTGWIANHLSADLICANEMVETLRLKMQAPYLGRVAYQGGFSPASAHRSLHVE